MFADDCFIFEVSSGRRVPAVVRPTRRADLLLVARDWIPLWPADAGHEDRHWDWPSLVELCRAAPDQFACYSLFADNQLQGLRVLEVSEDEVELYGTHAFRLSTAPWNRPPERRYRGVGSLLVAAGLLRSQVDGHDGALHCEALHGAEAFHANNGMTRFGLADSGLGRYRFEPQAARVFLSRLRNGGYLVGTKGPNLVPR